MNQRDDALMGTLIHRRVAACRAGAFEQAICRVHSGWVVLGDAPLMQAIRERLEQAGIAV
jgi:hypothetical protein